MARTNVTARGDITASGVSENSENRRSNHEDEGGGIF